jgi:carboxymethylenebutenolidase
MGTAISYKRPDGAEAHGYLTLAARGDAPGVVVLQEWWGLQDQVKGLCDRFAAAGFTALAPDLYGGKVVPYHDRDEASRSMDALDFADACGQSVQGAVDFLKRNGAKIGVIGYCMGGAIAVLSAAKVKGLSAAVTYYGLPPESAVKAADQTVSLQGHFATRDDWCTPEVVESFESGLKAAGKTCEIHSYQADHAFANEQRLPVHDRKAAELAWSRTVDFLSRHLA